MSAQSARHSPMIPRGAIAALVSIAVFTFAAAGAVRLSGIDVREPDAVAVETRALRFEDLPDGSVAVIDPHTGARVETVTGEQGFLRGVLRGLARERKRSGLGSEQPFELIGRADGRLTLSDPATGRLIDLESFGPTNAAVFAQMLTAAPQRP